MLTNSLCIIFRKSSAFTRSYIYCTVTEQQLLELFSHQESSDFTRSHTLYCHKTKPLEIDFIFEKYFTCRMDVFAYDIWIIYNFLREHLLFPHNKFHRYRHCFLDQIPQFNGIPGTISFLSFVFCNVLYQ